MRPKLREAQQTIWEQSSASKDKHFFHWELECASGLKF
jgi:hypothetical protein